MSTSTSLRVRASLEIQHFIDPVIAVVGVGGCGIGDVACRKLRVREIQPLPLRQIDPATLRDHDDSCCGHSLYSSRLDHPDVNMNVEWSMR